MANKSNKDFVRKHYAAFSTDQPEKGFEYGVDSVENDKELKAFYAGVGYGKHQYKEPLGFEHDDQRKAFERGVAARQRHLTAYQGPRKQSFLDRLLASLLSAVKSRMANGGKRSSPSRKRSRPSRKRSRPSRL